VRLTKRAIEAATYTGENGARCMLWDSVIPGFGCRVYPSGKKAFVLSYRLHGKKRLITLGRVGVLSLDDARSRARAKLTEVQDLKVFDREANQTTD
jgi:hypothetical protein